MLQTSPFQPHESKPISASKRKIVRPTHRRAKLYRWNECSPTSLINSHHNFDRPYQLLLLLQITSSIYDGNSHKGCTDAKTRPNSGRHLVPPPLANIIRSRGVSLHQRYLSSPTTAAVTVSRRRRSFQGVPNLAGASARVRFACRQNPTAMFVLGRGRPAPAAINSDLLLE